MHVLVTGASGFIGRVATRALLARGHSVVALQRSPLAPDAPLETIQADVRSPEARQAAARVDAVLHLAGSGDVQASWAEPAEALDVLVRGTLNLLEGVRTARGRLVLASTQRVYRPARRPLRESSPTRPADPYALAKLTAEGVCRLYAERYGLTTRAARLFSVYGPGQAGQGNSGVVAIFLRQALAGEPIKVDHGPRRDFTQVDDVARGLCLALELGPRGYRIYNLATGRGTALQELAEAIVSLVGSSSTVETVGPPWRGGDLVADVARARQELGYRPTIEFDAGLADLIHRP